MSGTSTPEPVFGRDDIVFWMQVTLEAGSTDDALKACVALLRRAGVSVYSVAKSPEPPPWDDGLPQFRIIADRSDQLRAGENAEAGMRRLFDTVMPALGHYGSAEMNGPRALSGVAFPRDEGEEVTTVADVMTRVQMGDRECPFDDYDEPDPEPEPELTPEEAAEQKRRHRQMEAEAAAEVVGVAIWTVGWGPLRSRDALLAWEADLGILHEVNPWPPRDGRGWLRLTWWADRPDGSAAEALAAVRARLPFTGWHPELDEPVSRTWWEADPPPTSGFVRVELVVGMTTLWSEPWWTSGAGR